MHGLEASASEEVKERESFLLGLGDALRDLDDPAEIQAVASRLLGQHLRANRVAYGEITEHEVIISRDYVDGVRSMVGQYPVDAWGASQAWKTREVIAVDDVLADAELPEGARATFRAVEVAAYIAVTLVKEGRWVAALGVHSATPRHWTAREIELVRQVADRTWAAVRRAHAEAALRESEHRYAAIFDTSPFAIALVRTSDHTILEANAAFFRLLEFAPEEVLGRSGSLLGVIDAESQQRLRRELDAQGAVRDFPTTLRTKSGAVRLGALNLDRVRVAGERHLLATIRDLTDLRRAEEAARLYERSKERLLDLDTMERLHAVSSRFFGEGGPTAVLEAILDAAIAIAEADAGDVEVICPRSADVGIVCHRGLPAVAVSALKNRGATRAARDHRERVIVEDVTRSELVAADEVDLHLAAGLRATQSTPLITRSGVLVGVISTHYGTPHRPTARVLRLLDLLARQAADLLERSNAEAALRRSETVSTGILETSMDAIISIDEHHRITLFNTGAEKIFGYTRAEALGAPLDLLLPEHARADYRRHVAEFAAGDQVSRSIAICARRKNGDEFPAEAAVSKLVVDGTTILTAQGRDITERRRIEREQHFLAELGDALSSFEYQSALDEFAHLAATSLGDFATVFVLRNEGVFSAVAAAATDPANESCAEVLVGQPISPRTRHPLWRAVETRSPVMLPLDPDAYEAIALSSEQLRALHALRPRYLLLVPMIALDQVVGVLSLGSFSRPFGEAQLHLANEAARRGALFIENERLHRAAQQAIRERDDMLGVVAHDLRSPLNTIILHAQMLGAPGGQPHGQVEISSNVIMRVGRRMTRIIEDLLEVTRAEAGHLTIEPARLAVRTLVDDVVEALGDQVIARSLALRVDVPANLPEVRGDRGRVLQVFENLVGNAMKFTADGSITIGARRGDGEVQFWVADTGSGIAPEQLAHVFDRFWQARGTTRRTGAGLGLAIVKGIVEAHGGRVWLESALDAGTTFFFTLPVAEVPRGDRSGKVLVAEDDPDTRAALVEILESRGFQVEAVADGATALAHLRASPPAVMILDLSMPVMDGWAVLAERARHPALQGIPVIVASGQPEVAERVITAQASYLSKPVSPERLLTMIEGAIG